MILAIIPLVYLRVKNVLIRVSKPSDQRIHILFVTCIIITNLLAQPTLTPPLDPIPKEFLPGVGYWENGGQVTDYNDAALNEIQFYSEGVVPRTGFMAGGHLALVHEIFSSDSTLPIRIFVTKFPVDAQQVDPAGFRKIIGIQENCLSGHMAAGAEECIDTGTLSTRTFAG